MRLLRAFVAPLAAKFVSTTGSRLVVKRPVAIMGALTTLSFMTASRNIFAEEYLTVETPDNLKDGEVREVQVGPKLEDTILVIGYEGQVYSTQSKCSHFGFNLAKGTIFGDKIICPLHNAGFSIKTGEAEQGPVFDGLKTFPVHRENGKIQIKVPKAGWDTKPQRAPLGKHKVDQSKKIVIVGGGPASQSAVDTLRDKGYTGLIYVISKEEQAAYDRTLLSKMMDPTKVPGPIRNQAHNDEDGVVFLGNTTVEGIDFETKEVKLSSHKTLNYDKLLIATGLVNVAAPITGLDKVKYSSLRNSRDYKEINALIRGQNVKNITIVGAGFIGLQTASSIKLALKDAVNVTLIETQQTPLAHVLGNKVGSVLKDLCAQNGVNLITSAKIKEVKGENGAPKSVVLEDRQVVTDALIVATGVKPATELVPNLVDKQTRGVKTNIYLETEVRDVFAAGDVASYPYWYSGERVRVEHFNEAVYQGSVAALNMMGRRFPVDNIPFFWTRSFNNTIGVTGILQGWDDIHIQGSLTEMKFIAYYISRKDDKVIGAAIMGLPNQCQIINEAMRNGVMPSATKVKNPEFKLESLLPDIAHKKPKCTRCNCGR